MKVNDPNLTGVNPERVGNAGLDKSQRTEAGRRGSSSSRAGAGDSPDSVSLSGLSSQLRAQNVDSPERASRMEKLSLDVSSREYQVDAMELSQRLVEDAIRPSL